MKSLVKALVVLAILSNVVCLDLGQRFGFQKGWQGWAGRTMQSQRIQVIRWLQPVCVVPGEGVPLCPKPSTERRDGYNLNDTQHFQADQSENSNAEQQKYIVDETETGDSKRRVVSPPKLLSPRIVYSTEIEGVDRADIASLKVSSRPDVGYTVIVRTDSHNPGSGEPGVHREKKYLVITGDEETVAAELPKPAIYVTRVLRSPVTATLVAKRCFPEIDVPMCEEHEETLTIHEKQESPVSRDEKRRNATRDEVDDSLRGSSNVLRKMILPKNIVGGVEPSRETRNSTGSNVDSTESFGLKNSSTNESRKTPPLPGQTVRNFPGGPAATNTVSPPAKDVVGYRIQIVATPTMTLYPGVVSTVTNGQNVEIDVTFPADEKPEVIENVSVTSEGGLIDRFLNSGKLEGVKRFWDFGFDFFGRHEAHARGPSEANHVKSPEVRIKVPVAAPTTSANPQNCVTEATTAEATTTKPTTTEITTTDAATTKATTTKPTTTKPTTTKPTTTKPTTTKPTTTKPTTTKPTTTKPTTTKPTTTEPTTTKPTTTKPTTTKPTTTKPTTTKPTTTKPTTTEPTTTKPTTAKPTTTKPTTTEASTTGIPTTQTTEEQPTVPMRRGDEFQTTTTKAPETFTTLPTDSTTPSVAGNITDRGNVTLKNESSIFSHPTNNSVFTEKPGGEPLPEETTTIDGEETVATVGPLNIIVPVGPLPDMNDTTIGGPVKPRRKHLTTTAAPTIVSSTTVVPSNPATLQGVTELGKNVTDPTLSPEPNNKTENPSPNKSNTTAVVEESSTPTAIDQSHDAIATNAPITAHTEPVPTSTVDEIPATVPTLATTSASVIPIANTTNKPETAASTETTTSPVHITPNVTEEITATPAVVPTSSADISTSPSVATSNVTNMPDVTVRNKTTQVPAGPETTVANIPDSATTTGEPPVGTTEKPSHILNSTTKGGQKTEKLFAEPPDGHGTLSNTTNSTTPSGADKSSDAGNRIPGNESSILPPPANSSPITKEPGATTPGATETPSSSAPALNESLSDVRHEMKKEAVDVHREVETTSATPATVSGTTVAPSATASSQNVTNNTTVNAPQGAENTTATVEKSSTSTAINQSHGDPVTSVPIIAESEKIPTSTVDKIPETVLTLANSSASAIPMVNVTNIPETAASTETTTSPVHIAPNVTEEIAATPIVVPTFSVNMSTSPSVAISNATNMPDVAGNSNATQVEAQQEPLATSAIPATVSGTTVAPSATASSQNVTNNTTTDAPQRPVNTTALVGNSSASTTIDESHRDPVTSGRIIDESEKIPTSTVDKIPETVPTLANSSASAIPMVNVTNKPETAASTETTTSAINTGTNLPEVPSS